MNQLLNSITLNAFVSETNNFTKVAQWGAIAKFTGSLGKLFNTTEWGSKLLSYSDELSKLKSSADKLNYVKKFSTNPIKRGPDNILTAANLPANEGFIQKRVGDFADYISQLSNGINKNQSLWKNTQQGFKNFISAEKDLYRNAFYKIHTNTDKTNIITKNGTEYVQSRAFGPLKHIFGDRKVLGYTDEVFDEATKQYVRHPITQKRIFPQVLGATFTPTGLVGSGILMGDSAKDSLKEVALWAPPTRILGETKMVKDMIF